MGKLDKLKEIIRIGSTVSKPFVPGSVGTVLDAVNRGIGDKADPKNEQALKDLAEVNDQQTQAILAIDERLRRLENK